MMRVDSGSVLHRLARHDRLLVAAALVLVALLVAAYWNYTQDDVFITYVYSRNIAQGHGFVFNPGERVQGTTTPLYALLMAGVYPVTHDLLHAGNLLGGLFLLIAIMLALDLTRRVLSVWGRAALAVTLAVSPLIYVSLGMETLLYIALLVLAFWLWDRERRPAAMLAAAALTWTRADGVVLAGAFGLLALWEALRSAPPSEHSSPARLGRRFSGVVKLAFVYLAGIAPWFLFAWAYFGTPLPQTFSAKEELFKGFQFWTDGWTRWQSFYGNNPLSLLAIPLIVLGAWQALIRPGLRPLAVWTALYLAGYTALNVTAFWYYTPLLAVLIGLAALGGDWLARRLTRAGLSRRVALGGGLALVLISGGLAVLKAWDYHAPPPRMATYRLAGEWIAQHTAPGDTLLVKDLGVVGYYAHRRTLDSFGLIVPDMHYRQDAYAAAKYKPDWIVITQYWALQRLAVQDWFNYHYVPMAQFSTPGDGEFSPMTVYRRRLPLQAPAEAVQGFDLPLTCTVHLAQGDLLPITTNARLLSASGDTLAEAAHPFLWSQYPAARATAPEDLVEQIALPLAVPPGRYRWDLDCDQTYTGEVAVLPVDQAAGYTPLAPAPEWGGFARLSGIAVPDGASTWSGGSLALLLDWEALGPADQDYSVFVHLADASGRVVAQTDGYPRGGERPSSTWAAGETIVDLRRIVLPPDLPPGEYHLVVGWYDWRTSTRLPLPGHEDDALILPVTVYNQWPGGSGRP
jgi:hypothetical protein